MLARPARKDAVPSFLGMQHASWSKIYALLGLAGMAAAVAGGLALPREGHAALQPWPAAVPAAGRSCGGMGRAGSGVGREALVHLLMLCFVHSVIRCAGYPTAHWRHLQPRRLCAWPSMHAPSPTARLFRCSLVHRTKLPPYSSFPLPSWQLLFLHPASLDAHLPGF
mgnify:CR=1 FL=1